MIVLSHSIVRETSELDFSICGWIVPTLAAKSWIRKSEAREE